MKKSYLHRSLIERFTDTSDEERTVARDTFVDPTQTNSPHLRRFRNMATARRDQILERILLELD